MLCVVVVTGQTTIEYMQRSTLNLALKMRYPPPLS